MNNFIEVRNRIPFRSSFMYIDTKEYLADRVFKNHDLYGVRFYKYELHKEQSNFVIIKCSIWEKDIDKFHECMEHLSRVIEFEDNDMKEYGLLCRIFEVAELVFNKDGEQE